MNIIANFVILVSISTIIISMTDNFLVNSYAQSAGKEIVIGPDPSKDGDDVYNPNNITINKGDKIMWVNKDFGIHTVTDNQGLFGSKDLRPDQTFEYTFDDAGTYDYHCKLHPEMTGKIIVN
jgi:plastocyanin